MCVLWGAILYYSYIEGKKKERKRKVFVCERERERERERGVYMCLSCRVKNVL